MRTVRVTTTIDRPPDAVWAVLADVAGHVRWMRDAVAIRFTSTRRHGVGTAFDCDTRVGPLRLRDRMEIVEWQPGAAMGVRHVGAVSGTGRFTLHPRHDGARTELVWHEALRFPWWLGGPLGAAIGAPVLARIWRHNLASLRALVEGR